MPSGRPIDEQRLRRRARCTRGRPRRARRPSKAAPQRVRANSRSSRSQMAYAAYSRSLLEEGAQQRAVRRRRGRRPPSGGRARRWPSAATSPAALGRRRVGSARRDRGGGAVALAARHRARRSDALDTAPRSTPSSVTIAGDQLGRASRRTPGCGRPCPAGAMRTPRTTRTSSARALLDRDRGAVGRRRGRPS